MSIHATFDKNGLPTAFYDDGIHENIPENAIKITLQQWHAFINNPGLRKWEDGHVVTYVPPHPSPDPRLKRDAALASSDWVALRAMDSGGTVPQEWVDYRQALRDYPETLVWPKEPANG